MWPQIHVMYNKYFLKKQNFQDRSTSTLPRVNVVKH